MEAELLANKQQRGTPGAIVTVVATAAAAAAAVPSWQGQRSSSDLCVSVQMYMEI
jgi:hypothetical protein